MYKQRLAAIFLVFSLLITNTVSHVNASERWVDTEGSHMVQQTAYQEKNEFSNLDVSEDGEFNEPEDIKDDEKLGEEDEDIKTPEDGEEPDENGDSKTPEKELTGEDGDPEIPVDGEEPDENAGETDEDLLIQLELLNLAEGDKIAATEQDLRQILDDLQDGETINIILTNDIYLGDNSIVSYNAALGDGSGENAPLVINNSDITINFMSDVPGEPRVLYRIDAQRHFVIDGRFYQILNDITLTFTDVELDGLQQYDVQNTKYNVQYDSSRGGFYVRYVDGLTIKGLKLANCFSGEYLSAPSRYDNLIEVNGGAMSFSVCNDLLLEDCVFENNVSAWIGGALNFLTAGDVELVNCTFIGNGSDRGVQGARGGAINVDGSRADTEIIIDDCTFLDNYAIARALSSFRDDMDIPGIVTIPDYGGAICIYGSPNSLIITGNTVFRGNSADQGGAIFFYGDNSDLTIDGNVEITGNFARNKHHMPQGEPISYNNAIGGGIYLANAGGSSISGNVKIEGNVAESVNGSAYGGGMMVGDALLLSGKVLFKDNKAINSPGSNVGGGMYLQSSLTATGDQIVFQENQAHWGGGIYAQVREIQDLVHLDETVFHDNHAVAGGGAVAIGTAYYDLLACTGVTFSGNTAEAGGCYLEINESYLDEASFNEIAAIYGSNITGTKSLSLPFELGEGEYAYNNYDIYFGDGTPAPKIIINYYLESVNGTLIDTLEVSTGRRSEPNASIINEYGGAWKDLCQPVDYHNGVIVDPRPLPDVVGENDLIVSVTYSPIIRSIEANPTDLSFEHIEGDETAPEAKAVTVTNTGTAGVALTKSSTENYFEISDFAASNLASNTSTTFTVQPKSGLSAGVYEDTITIRGTYGVTASVEVRLIVYEPLSVTVSPETAAVLPGEEAAFTVTAAGGNGSPYTYQWQWQNEKGIWNAMNGEISETLAVSRNSVGTYQFRCQASDGFTQVYSEACTLVVSAEPVPVLSVKGPVFGNVTTGYTQPNPKAIVIANSGSGPAVIERVEADGKFTIVKDTLTSNEVAAGGSNETWGVQPDANLSAGTYQGTITVIYNSGKKAAATLQFVVESSSNPGNPGGSGGSGGSGCTVRFDSTGGSSVSSQRIDRGGKVKEPADPLFEGRRFAGWYTDTELTTLYDFGKEVNSSFTLYAAWEAAEEITEIHYAYINGYPNGTFQPEGFLTRAEAAAMLYNISLRDGRTREGQFAVFPDVDQSDWYYNTIGNLGGWNIIQGYRDGSFKPDEAITRAEFVTMTMRFIGMELSNGQFFSDVPAEHWAVDKIAAAVSAGHISGYPDGSFGPERSVTRAEAVTILNHVIGCTSIENGSKFSDLSSVHWAYEDIAGAATEHESDKDKNER